MWAPILPRLKRLTKFVRGKRIDAAHTMQHCDDLSRESVNATVRALINRRTEKDALANLAAILLVKPEYGDCLSISALERVSQSDTGRALWHHLALLLLYTSQKDLVAQWLNEKLKSGQTQDCPTELIEHLSAWHPQLLVSDSLQKAAENYPDEGRLTALYQRQLFYENQDVYKQQAPPESMQKLLAKGGNILLVQNISDGFGDEVLRTATLVQGLVDTHPEIEITIFTERPFLFDHPRICSLSIKETDVFRRQLDKDWDGIINFYEPYLPENSFNHELEPLIQERLKSKRPSLYIWARKDVNHSVFESVTLESKEFAHTWELQKRKIPLNYETTMRLASHLGLALRTGENLPGSGSIFASSPSQASRDAWLALKTSLQQKNGGQARPIAIVNPFGGQKLLKGFHSHDYHRLASLLSQITEEGFDLVVMSSRESWGSMHEVDTILKNLPPAVREHAVSVQQVDGQTPQQSMRRNIDFISMADLIVCVEGWTMHVAYSMGKRFRLFMAPYSQKAEWQPHGRTAKQSQLLRLSAIEQSKNFRLPEASGSTPPVLHYPEKDMLHAAFEIWKKTSDRTFAQRLLYWMGSLDSDIRKWTIETVGTIDCRFFQAELLKSLKDCNREVRAAGARTLLAGGIDLTNELGPDWRNVLEAYRLLGQYRFMELAKLGHAAYLPLRSCLNNDEFEVNRDAKIMLERMNMSRLEAHKEPPRNMALPKILILTPVKNAAHDAPGYFERLLKLDYPRHLLSLGILESDSTDNTFAAFESLAEKHKTQFSRINCIRKDFGYVIPEGVPRWQPNIQYQRRSILAFSRNELLQQTLTDEEWVLWLDSDVLEFPPDVIQRLLSYGKDIIQPHCVLRYGGQTFDLNAWRNHASLFMHDLRTEGEITELHAVGGTMLLIRADCHRAGLIFPTSLYGKDNPKVRSREDIGLPGERGELETEGLGIMAADMNIQCWGLPHLEIIHADR